MTETDLDTQPPAPARATEAKDQTPWESMDPDEPAQPVRTAQPVVHIALAQQTPEAAMAAAESSARAGGSAAGAGAKMAGLASELQSLLAKERFSPFDAMIAAPLETVEDHLLAKAFLSDEGVKSFEQSFADPDSSNVAVSKRMEQPAASEPAPPVATESEPAAIDHTPWATIDQTQVESIPAAPAGQEPVIHEPVIHGIESAAPLEAEGAEIEEPTPAVSNESTVEAIVESEPVLLADTVDPHSAPPANEQTPSADLATTFAPAAETLAIAMTAPVAVDDSAAASLVAPATEQTTETLADEPVVVLDYEPGELAATAHEAIAQTQVAAEPQLQTEVVSAPAPVATGGGWTIPIMCLGIGLIACCLAIPQLDFNRRLRYEQQNLQVNLQSVEKQVAVNDEFLKNVMDDPTLAERLAGRQLKKMRKGQKVVPVKDISDDGDMSPFALVAVAPPLAPPPYSPIKGTIANICNNAHARLYLLGAAMTMVAVGLVMGASSKM